MLTNRHFLQIGGSKSLNIKLLFQNSLKTSKNSKDPDPGGQLITDLPNLDPDPQR
jgi:hypothetical protein